MAEPSEGRKWQRLIRAAANIQHAIRTRRSGECARWLSNHHALE